MKNQNNNYLNSNKSALLRRARKRNKTWRNAHRYNFISGASGQ